MSLPMVFCMVPKPGQGPEWEIDSLRPVTRSQQIGYRSAGSDLQVRREALPPSPLLSLCVLARLPGRRPGFGPREARRSSAGIVRHGEVRAMPSAAAQILAFVLALLGTVGATVATLLPNWQVSIRVWSSMVAPMWQTRGLWMDCVWYGTGVFSCTTTNSSLVPPPYMQTTRAAMVLSCALAVFGLGLATVGLRCTRWGGGHRTKGRTSVAAGGCFVLAGALCLGPASWFTSEVLATFMSAQQPDGSKYQPGGALCVTFISAGFLLVGGVIFCLSCPGSALPDYPTPTELDGLALARLQRCLPQARRDSREKTLGGVDAPEVEKTHASPSRRPPKEVKDNYRRQEYV